MHFQRTQKIIVPKPQTWLRLTNPPIMIEPYEQNKLLIKKNYKQKIQKGLT